MLPESASRWISRSKPGPGWDEISAGEWPAVAHVDGDRAWGS
ncbi:MAG: hypothetical protein RXP97_00310 [Nitrososphaeria archaeon]